MVIEIVHINDENINDENINDDDYYDLTNNLFILKIIFDFIFFIWFLVMVTFIEDNVLWHTFNLIMLILYTYIIAVNVTKYENCKIARETKILHNKIKENLIAVKNIINKHNNK